MQDSPRVEKPQELTYAEQLVSENKYLAAFQVLKELNQKEKILPNHRISSLLLQGRLLIWLGRYEESLIIVEQAYKESLLLENNLQTVGLLNMLALIQNFLDQFDKAREIIKKSEDLFNTFTKESSIEYISSEAFLNYVKGLLLSQDDVDRGLEYLEDSVLLWEKLDTRSDWKQITHAPVKQSELVLYPITIMCIGMAMNLKGDLNQSIKFFNQGLAIAEKINNKYGIALILHRLGTTYHLKGEINLALNSFEESLRIFKEIENKTCSAMAFNSIGALMGEKGEYQLALKSLEKSIAIYEEINLPSWVLDSLGAAIEISLKTDNLKKAQQQFERFKQIAVQFNNDEINLWQNLLEALILKKSSRIRNRAKAEGIFKEIIKKDGIHPPSFHHPTSFGTYMTSLIHLCDLFLIELRSTNDLEVLNELEHYIAQLLESAEKSDSYLLLCETHLLQAKLSLLTYDITKAKRYLTQAQQIAERHSLNQIAMKISNEYEDLLKKLDLWERLKESEAPMADRMKLSRLDENIIQLIQNKSILKAHVSEEKVAIHKEKKICLVCRGEVLKFSYICECGAIYCENCARAVSNLENVCWACETQIDTLKPVKPFKEGKSVELGKK
jgi:tetratricopeptide (TPR) repeat protein